MLLLVNQLPVLSLLKLLSVPSQLPLLSLLKPLFRSKRQAREPASSKVVLGGIGGLICTPLDPAGAAGWKRQVIASVLLTPLAIIFARRSAPKASTKILIKIFMVSLLGMETFQPKSLPGITKIAGIVICIGGVLFIAFYQGTKLKPLNLLHIESFLHRSRNHNYVNENRNRWMLGSFLLFLCGLFWALCTVLQGMLLKEYPDNLLLSTLMTIFSTFQSCIIAFIFEKNMEKWNMHWDVGLLAVVYNGVFVSGPVLYLTGYCIKRKGAVFTAMFSPVTVVFTLIIASVLLGEITSLGSLLGCLLMIGGLYCVLWGKSREKKHVVEH